MNGSKTRAYCIHAFQLHQVENPGRTYGLPKISSNSSLSRVELSKTAPDPGG